MRSLESSTDQDGPLGGRGRLGDVLITIAILYYINTIMIGIVNLVVLMPTMNIMND